jgi:hypothetical protein
MQRAYISPIVSKQQHPTLTPFHMWQGGGGCVLLTSKQKSSYQQQIHTMPICFVFHNNSIL